MSQNRISKLFTVLLLVSVFGCSARIGVPIPRDDRTPNKHPSGTIIIIETDSKTKVEPRTK